MNRTALRKLVRSTPPRCLRRLKARLAPMPAKWGRGVAMRWDVAAAWRLVCRCGSGEGAVLGHPLVKFRPELKGDRSFVGPFAFRCGRCGKTTKFLDTDVDGTYAELAKLEDLGIPCATYRGTGRKQPFPCSKCGASRGRVVVALFFTADYTDELEEDGIAFPFENLFSGVRVYSRCSGCGKQARVTDIDTKY